jgi:hypothetical protein
MWHFLKSSSWIEVYSSAELKLGSRLIEAGFRGYYTPKMVGSMGIAGIA